MRCLVVLVVLRFLISFHLIGTALPESFSEQRQHVSSNHQYTSTHQQQQCPPLPPPPPPLDDIPIRFQRAGKGNMNEAQRRYLQTLQWRQNERIDTILREPFPDYFTIKEHYPHYYHLTGYNGEPVYYEQPAKTNLKALRQRGIDFNKLLRHYMMITEYQWQMLSRDDFMQSIFVVDLDGIKLSDFVGDTVQFVKAASKMAAVHYPERAGKVFVVNVPRWFHLIWQVVKPIVDESTLRKIFILRGKEEILANLSQHIPIDNIPPEYGGSSPLRLGESPQEELLARLMNHNMQLYYHQKQVCEGCHADCPPENWPCRFCSWVPARSY